MSRETTYKCDHTKVTWLRDEDGKSLFWCICGMYEYFADGTINWPLYERGGKRNIRRIDASTLKTRGFEIFK